MFLTNYVVVSIVILSWFGCLDADLYNLLCNRIYFKHPSEKVFPYINALSGVYIKTNRIKDKFPVYRNERGNAFFVYRKLSQKFYFSKSSTNTKDFIGVAVKARTWILESPPSWIRTINNVSKPLGDVFSDRFYYHKDKRTIKIDIEPICVSFITDCDFKPLVFTNTVVGDNGTVLQNTFLHDFRIIQNQFQENRRVYIHTNHKMSNYSLFYHSGYWTIGPDITKAAGFFSVKSNALKPELITEKWRSASTQGGWNEINATLQCRGLSDENCSPSLCQNSGICNKNALNESVCTCQYGFEGANCEKSVTKKCGDNFSSGFMTVNDDEGAVTTEFCPGQWSTTVRTLLCHKYNNKKLAWYGIPCPVLPTTAPYRTSSTTSYRRRFTTTTRSWRRRRIRFRERTKVNVDENESLMIAIKVLVIIVPVLILPIFHYCCYSCYRQSRGKELSEITSMCSLHAYFGVFVWFAFCVCYVKYRLVEYGQSTFGYVFIAAVVFMILGYGYVLFETWTSSVMGYLRSSIDVEGNAEAFIRTILAERPSVMTIARAFHWETRTRQVSYTDANGNTQYRTETYQEKVVTWTGFDSFNFGYWKDISDIKAIPKCQLGEIVRVKLDNDIGFANDETKFAFYEQKRAFIDANKHRDVYIEDETSYEIPNFKEHVMSYDSQQGLPCWMSSWCFCMWTFICCSWPYRWIIRCYTKKKYFTVKKIISISPIELPVLADVTPSAPSLYIPQPIPSFAPPPSYGEAVQMTPVYPPQAAVSQVNPAFQSV